MEWPRHLSFMAKFSPARWYPGRTETERITHMTRIGDMVEAMVLSLVRNLKPGE